MAGFFQLNELLVDRCKVLLCISNPHSLFLISLVLKELVFLHFPQCVSGFDGLRQVSKEPTQRSILAVSVH